MGIKSMSKRRQVRRARLNKSTKEQQVLQRQLRVIRFPAGAAYNTQY